MLINLTFSNFYSFAEETEVSFKMGKKPAPSLYDIQLDETRRLNKVLTVVGPNGSGKTQFIKAIGFLAWMICDSFLRADPKKPILFNPHMLQKDEPTSLEATFLLNGYEYKYKLVLNNDHILHESLHKKTSHLFSYVFVREKKGSSYTFKQRTFGFSSNQAQTLRGNATILSAAHNFDVSLASEVVSYFRQTVCNVRVTGRAHFHEAAIFDAAEFLYNNDNVLTHVKQAVQGFDLGISDLKIGKGETTNTTGEIKDVYVPVTTHISKKGHFELSLFEESSGTQSAFVLLSYILPVLLNGGLAVIDEIDNDLHPHLLPHILDLFKHGHTNPHQAQIIFTCHTPEILNLLMKHQVYLVEKEDQESEAWRLDEVTGLRADDNLYAKYMAGALSAVPNL